MKKLRTYLLSLGILMIMSFSLSAQGNALNFNGTNDAVDLPENAALAFQANSSFTLEAWFRTSVNSATDQTIFTNQSCLVNAGTQRHVILTVRSGRIFSRIAGASNTEIVVSLGNTPVADGLWHHVALNLDFSNSVMVVYVDGNVESTTPHNIVSDPSHSTSENWLGRRSTCSSSTYFNGELDEVRIWNSSRTQTEIQSNMCGVLTGSETGLTAYYNFDQGVGGGNNSGITTLVDQAGSNDGTLQNFSLNGNSSNWVGSNAHSSLVCQSITPIPTLSQWGLILLALTVVSIGTITVWRKRDAFTAQ